MGIDSFRKRAREITNSSKKNSNRSGGFWNRWKPPKFSPKKHTQPVAEPVIFIDVEYVDIYKTAEEGCEVKQPFYHARQHTFKYGPRDFRTLVCSSGADPHDPKPCVSCVQVDHGIKAPARDQLAFNVAHLVNYHYIPYVKDGQVLHRTDNNEPVMISVQCEGRGCSHCKTGAETKFGEHRYIQVGTGHLGNILTWDAKVSNFCSNCTTPIAVLGYACRGCKNQLLDVASSGYSNEELAQFVRSPVRCTSCGTEDITEEVLDCGYDPTGSSKMANTGCMGNSPTKRLSLFDVVLYLQREGEGADSTMVDVSWIPKGSFPLSPEGKTLEELLPEIVKRPFDFESIFEPLPLGEQATRLGVENPYSNNPPAYQSYGGGQQGTRATPGIPGRPDYRKV